MNDSDPVQPQSHDGLQFDHADYDEASDPVPTCAGCKRDIPDAYFECNGQVLCLSCADGLHENLTGGSRSRRFFRAALFGSAAALAGFGIYFGILKLTGFELALISILVGFMVGGAVRKGCDARGGWVYQIMAMFLTYTAIVASYAALFIPLMIAQGPPVAAANQAGAKGAAQAAQAAPAVAPGNPQKPLFRLLGLIFLVGLVFALPILTGFQNPISLLIIAFALWEAWKINKKMKIAINGPYSVGEGTAAVTSHV